MASSSIRYYREQVGLSQVALARALELDPSLMSRLEAGQLIPTAEQVEKLVQLLKVPPSYLFSKHVLAEVADRARAAS